MFQGLLATLPHFMSYFGVAVVLSVLFITLYVNITPHKEISLIKAGNTAVSIQLVGTFLGFVAPLAIIIGHSINLYDVMAWGAVALIVQVVTFYMLSLLFAGIEKRIGENCTSSGIFVGGISLGIGALQAACMVP